MGSYISYHIIIGLEDVSVKLPRSEPTYETYGKGNQNALYFRVSTVDTLPGAFSRSENLSR